MPDTKLNIYSTFLRDDVSRKYGGRLVTSTDFANLSQAIRDSKAGYVSPSTLKRFWGYVRDNYTGRRVATLDVLAAYLGHDSFSDYCSSIEQGDADFSGYNTAMSLDVQSLEPGSSLCITWHPDRRIRLTYLGDLTFTVDEVINSRLAVGSRVRTLTIIKGQPLILSVLPTDGLARQMIYIAGKTNGVEFRTL